LASGPGSGAGPLSIAILRRFAAEKLGFDLAVAKADGYLRTAVCDGSRHLQLKKQNVGMACLHALGGREEVGPDLSGLHEPIDEPIGLALDRRIEHLDRMRIGLAREHRAILVQHEAGRLDLLADGRGINPMQRLRIARACPGGGGMIDDDVETPRLQPLVDGPIEVGCGRTARPDESGVEIVVEQV